MCGLLSTANKVYKVSTSYRFLNIAFCQEEQVLEENSYTNVFNPSFDCGRFIENRQKQDEKFYPKVAVPVTANRDPPTSADSFCSGAIIGDK